MRTFAGFVLILFGWVGGLQAQVLTVVGEGSVAVVPDMATISVGVTSDASTAAEALDDTSVVTGELLTLLSEIGIEPFDMQTSGVRLAPLYSKSGSSISGQGISGYRAENTVRVHVRNLADLGVILDDIVANGANQLNGVSFGLQEPGPALDEARQAAVTDALRKGALYAAAADVALGPIQSISELDGSAPGPVAMRAASVPIAPGGLDVSASITVVFTISGG